MKKFKTLILLITTVFFQPSLFFAPTFTTREITLLTLQYSETPLPELAHQSLARPNQIFDGKFPTIARKLTDWLALEIQSKKFEDTLDLRLIFYSLNALIGIAGAMPRSSRAYNADQLLVLRILTDERALAPIRNVISQGEEGLSHSKRINLCRNLGGISAILIKLNLYQEIRLALDQTIIFLNSFAPDLELQGDAKISVDEKTKELLDVLYRALTARVNTTAMPTMTAMPSKPYPSAPKLAGKQRVETKDISRTRVFAATFASIATTAPLRRALPVLEDCTVEKAKETAPECEILRAQISQEAFKSIFEMPPLWASDRHTQDRDDDLFFSDYQRLDYEDGPSSQGAFSRSSYFSEESTPNPQRGSYSDYGDE